MCIKFKQSRILLKLTWRYSETFFQNALTKTNYDRALISTSKVYKHAKNLNGEAELFRLQIFSCEMDVKSVFVLYKDSC